jgi:ABC-type multidrug transport system ATPase subunit
MTNSRIQLHLAGDFEITIGNDPDSHVLLPGPEPVRATLKRAGDRLFFKVLAANDSTSLNHRALKSNRWTEVTRYDELVIAGTVLSLSPKFFLGRDRVGLDTTPLRYVLPGRAHRMLLNGPYLRARPGSFTAIIGPAGCGKTLLLNLLNGYLVPTAGVVSIAENFNPHRDYRLLKNFIGYVPQDDILIPELTVRQSLKYRLGLKFSDMSHATKDRLIYETCRQLGMDGDRTERFLDTAIGSADSRSRGLSGGERKRANIAHELITRPLILILDEPTSGLSSSDADQIGRLLVRLAKEDQLAVIASVHQPNASSFEQFDYLMALGYGGELVYYGAAERAVEFFEKSTSIRCAAENPAEYILDRVASPKEGARLHQMFEKARETLPYVPAPLCERDVAATETSSPTRAGKNSVRGWLRQWIILTQRNLAVLRTDKASLALALLQAPIIAALIFFAFQGFAEDTRDSDAFARTIFLFGLAKEPVEKSHGTVYADSLLRDAAKKSKDQGNHIGPTAAHRRGAIYFILVAASLWFGLLGGCREIVGEQHILKREVRTCVNLMPYLGSKTLVHILLTGLQTALLLIVLRLFPVGLEPIPMPRLWIVLWLVAIAAACLGFLISSVAPTYRAALTLVPVLMIPQLLFGGILRPTAEIEPSRFLPKGMATITLQYWGFRSALEVVSGSEKIVLQQKIQHEELLSDPPSRYQELNVLQFRESTLAHIYFYPPAAHPVAIPVLVLVGVGVLCLLLSYLVLRLKFW